MSDALDRIRALVGSEWVIPVGSRVTCNPPPTNTDEDYLVLAAHAGRDFWDSLRNDWDRDGSAIADDVNYLEQHSGFESFSRDGINLIVTRSEIFFRKFLIASDLAKRFNLLDKADRIALFQGVLYANRPMPELLPADPEEPQF